MRKTCRELGIEPCALCVRPRPNSVDCAIRWGCGFLDDHKNNMREQLMIMMRDDWPGLPEYYRCVCLFYPEYKDWMDKLMVLR
jgi:hypothetical protein